MGEGVIILIVLEIVENGNIVLIVFDVLGVVEVMLFVDGNFVLNVVMFKFGLFSVLCSVLMCIWLVMMQNVVVIVKMEDGFFQMVKVNVKVIIGGCGG